MDNRSQLDESIADIVIDNWASTSVLGVAACISRCRPPTLVAEDVGIGRGAVSAEEAAVHIIEDEE